MKLIDKYDLPELIIGLAIVACLVIIAGGLWSVATHPSCSDKGGKLKFQYYLPVYNGHTTTLVPMYKCVMPNEREKIQ